MCKHITTDYEDASLCGVVWEITANFLGEVVTVVLDYSSPNSSQSTTTKSIRLLEPQNRTEALPVEEPALIHIVIAPYSLTG